MHIELADEVNAEMYLLDCKTGCITPIDVVRESKSGNTVETSFGRRYKTDSKSYKVFYSYDFALIGSKQVQGRLDEEYDYLLKRNGLKRMTA